MNESRIARRQVSDRSAIGAAVVATGLTKDFRSQWTLKSQKAVDGLSMTIERGEIFGFLGPNGAGKTTTIKMLLGLLRPSAGAAWILGIPIGSTESRKGVGYLPERPSFFDRLTAREFLIFSGRLAGLDESDSRRRTEAWLERLGLRERANVRLRKFSKGMLQRVGLAHALLAEPELVFLDEPMSGLDPAGRREFRDIILECRKQGVTVVFSSHILPDAELLCDRVGVLSHGKLERIGSLDDLLADGSASAEVVVLGGDPLLLPPRFSAVRQRSHGNHLELTIENSNRLNELVSYVLEQNYELVSVTTRRRSLESVVLECGSGFNDSKEPDTAASTTSTDERRAG